jgi:hypothetical protein
MFPTSTDDEDLVKVCRNCKYDDEQISAALERLWEVRGTGRVSRAASGGGLFVYA